MPIKHPALPDPGAEQWRYVLACSHVFIGARIDNPYSPVICNHESHGDGGSMVSITGISRA